MTIQGINITEIITAVVNVLIGIVCMFITYKVIPWLKNKFEADTVDTIKDVVKSAVAAAEQLWIKEDSAGKSKLEYATDIINKELEAKKIVLDADILRSYIEAAVLELKKI